MNTANRFVALLRLIVVTLPAVAVTPTGAQALNPKPIAAEAPRTSEDDGKRRARNIVFIIMDDVGIDQLSVFGWGGPDPAQTPNIDAIARSGTMFGNVWAMPECSPSRAAFFTGRYPMRTGVTSALFDNMLPVSQVSPYETTIPRVLDQAGYASALVGKFHLGTVNPAGNCSPAVLGWSYFNGNSGASPGSIDTTAGNGTVAVGTGGFVCGFDQSSLSGACYRSGGSCQGGGNAKVCLESGGLFLANQACNSPVPSGLDFTRTNAYYVWQDIINEGEVPQNTGAGACPVQPVISRQYMTTAQTDGALQWWRKQTGPRMLTVAYNAIHTPLQQPPSSLAQSDPLLQCQGVAIGDQRKIGNAMLQAMDLEIGRLLQGMGLATLDTKGVIRTETDRNGDRRIPQLEESGTMVVIVGDNGTFAFLVKPPFDRLRSKGTVYQTGVGVPLIVAGSLVHSPTGRIDNHMISAADLFQLFGEIAGLDVNQIVPPAHVLDSKPMLVHVTDPHHGETRAHNYTELGEAVFKVPTDNTTRSWPCVVGGAVDRKTGAAATVNGGVCSDGLFSTRAFCEQENNGIWFGPPDLTDDGPLQVPNPDPNSYRQAWNSCCAVRALSTNPGAPISLLPTHQYAERDTRYKYVQREFADCSKPLCPGLGCDQVFPPFQRRTETEFYDLQQAPANPAGLDNTNLACSATSNQDPIACVPQALHAEFRSLQSALKSQLDSEAKCTGDGNLDKRVNLLDIASASALLGASPNSSVWDFNNDGRTDAADVTIIRGKLGADCIGMCQRADLDRDGSVDDKDISILKSHFGPCQLCGSDLNGDGVVDDLDVNLMKNAIKTCPDKKSKGESHEPAEK